MEVKAELEVEQGHGGRGMMDVEEQKEVEEQMEVEPGLPCAGAGG